MSNCKGTVIDYRSLITKYQIDQEVNASTQRSKVLLSSVHDCLFWICETGSCVNFTEADILRNEPSNSVHFSTPSFLSSSSKDHPLRFTSFHSASKQSMYMFTSSTLLDRSRRTLPLRFWMWTKLPSQLISCLSRANSHSLTIFQRWRRTRSRRLSSVRSKHLTRTISKPSASNWMTTLRVDSDYHLPCHAVESTTHM